MRLLLPPLAPPGYAGVNLMDLARGTKSGMTGQALQEGALRTVLANVAGIRTYEPKVAQQIGNIRHEEQATQAETTQLWKRWSFAIANGNYTGANEFTKQLATRMTPAQFLEGMKDHMPGSLRNVSAKTATETIRRASSFDAPASEIAPVYLRHLQTLSGGRR